MLRTMGVVALLVASSEVLAKDELTVQMQADLLTYESCADAMVERYISSTASAAEVATLADQNCAVYHNYFLDRAADIANQLAVIAGNESELAAFQDAQNDLLKGFRLIVEQHRENQHRHLVARISQSRSAP